MLKNSLMLAFKEELGILEDEIEELQTLFGVNYSKSFIQFNYSSFI